jgi:hypothetical protein
MAVPRNGGPLRCAPLMAPRSGLQFRLDKKKGNVTARASSMTKRSRAVRMASLSSASPYRRHDGNVFVAAKRRWPVCSGALCLACTSTGEIYAQQGGPARSEESFIPEESRSDRQRLSSKAFDAGSIQVLWSFNCWNRVSRFFWMASELSR